MTGNSVAVVPLGAIVGYGGRCWLEALTAIVWVLTIRPWAATPSPASPVGHRGCAGNRPLPDLARLRREAPVCCIPAVRLWFVTRYDDVEFVGTIRSCSTPNSTTRRWTTPSARRPSGPSTARPSGTAAQPRLQVPAEVRQRLHRRPGAPDRRTGGRWARRPGPGRTRSPDYLEPVSVLSLGTVLGVAHLGAAGCATGSGGCTRE